MRMCLVDDESTHVELLKTIIEQWADKINITVDIDIYHSSEEMLFESNDTYPYDLIILDIQMGKMNGLNLAKKIRQIDKKVMIAFISGITDYVYEGYEVQAIRYILKPIKKENVFELLDLVKNQMTEENNKYIIISCAGEMKKINYEDIVYFKSMGHYITVHLENMMYDYKYSITELNNRLDSMMFVRTHKSYIVNMKYIERINRTECELINNITIPLSRNSYKTVNQKFIEYYKGNSIL